LEIYNSNNVFFDISSWSYVA